MARARGMGSRWILPDKRLAIYLRDQFQCGYCGSCPAECVTLTLDHFVSRELGGTNSEANLVTSCMSCNSSKGKMGTRGWFNQLRERGADTDRVRRKIRTQLKRDLTPFRSQAREILSRGVEYQTVGDLFHLVEKLASQSASEP